MYKRQIEQYDNSNRESLKNILKQFKGTDVWLIIKEEFGDRMTELMQLSGSVIKEESKKRNGLQQEICLLYTSIARAPFISQSRRIRDYQESSETIENPILQLRPRIPIFTLQEELEHLQPGQ